MATLADELLNDFEESDSEGEDGPDNGLFERNRAISTDGTAPTLEGAEMVVDEDEDAADGTNEKMLNDVEDADDAEEAKNQVEKMQFRGFSDVRSVTTIKLSLEPILEVSCPPTPPF